jgi:exopolysaccharide production protein ExoY
MTAMEAARNQARASKAEWGTRSSVGDGVIRVTDVVLAAVMLAFFAPTMILIALAVRAQDGGPALFRHARVGRNGEIFGCLKFRSMTTDGDAVLVRRLAADEAGRAEWARQRKLRRDPRVTPLGRLLRISSLDELPQLLNVLRGDMSLVGPRPIVAEEVWRYGQRYRVYMSVRPGLTGLWQVMGRNDVPYRRRVAMDVLLVRRRSVRTYCWILLRTVPAVLGRQGVY